eukprot:m.1599674 g.1599674  ORF g.1599674 m.1599674 type:complete len:488 (-) comp25348_c1_seq1:1670-3133(-)
MGSIERSHADFYLLLFMRSNDLCERWTGPLHTMWVTDYRHCKTRSLGNDVAPGMAMTSSSRHQELLRRQMDRVSPPPTRTTATRRSPVVTPTRLPAPTAHVRAAQATGSVSTARSSTTSGDDGLAVPADWNASSVGGSPLPAPAARQSPRQVQPPTPHTPPPAMARSATFSISNPSDRLNAGHTVQRNAPRPASPTHVDHRPTPAALRGDPGAGAGPAVPHPRATAAGQTGGGRYPAQTEQVTHIDACVPAVRRALAQLGERDTAASQPDKAWGARAAPQREAWQDKAEALRQLERLLTTKVADVLPAVDLIAHALATIAVPYAKTSVSKPALRLIAHMCDVLGPCLDGDVGILVTALCKKISAASGRRSFIHDEVVQTLHALAANVSLARLVPVLSQHLGDSASPCKDVLAGTLVQAVKCGEPAELQYCVPSLLDIGARLLADDAVRAAGVEMLVCLQGTPEWSDDAVNKHLQVCTDTKRAEGCQD